MCCLIRRDSTRAAADHAAAKAARSHQDQHDRNHHRYNKNCLFAQLYQISANLTCHTRLKCRQSVVCIQFPSQSCIQSLSALGSTIQLSIMSCWLQLSQAIAQAKL